MVKAEHVADSLTKVSEDNSAKFKRRHDASNQAVGITVVICLSIALFFKSIIRYCAWLDNTPSLSLFSFLTIYRRGHQCRECGIMTIELCGHMYKSSTKVTAYRQRCHT